MRLFKVCSRSVQEADALAKKLNGCWVMDGILATGVPATAAGVPAASLIKLVLGAEGAAPIHGHAEWSRNDSNIGRPSCWMRRANVGSCHNSWLIFDDTLALGQLTLECAQLVSRNDVRPTRSKLQVFNLGHNQLSSYELSAFMTLWYLREGRYCRAQILRRLRAGILRGIFNPFRMIELAKKLGNKMVAASIQLAHRGFKSKRFKPRELRPGDKVRKYYDKWPLWEQKENSILGTVDSFNDAVIYLSENGTAYNYKLDGTLNEVWPVVP